jgi:hypothetical protein
MASFIVVIVQFLASERWRDFISGALDFAGRPGFPNTTQSGSWLLVKADIQREVEAPARLFAQVASNVVLALLAIRLHPLLLDPFPCFFGLIMAV